MAHVIEINFDRPIAVFSLPQVVLLPHVAEKLFVFEPRYRQMIEACLEAGGGLLQGAAPIALASYAPRDWKGERVALQSSGLTQEPALRPIVCVGKIFEHHRLADGRHEVLMHGICRARIEGIEEANASRLYARAFLRPTESLHRGFGTIRALRLAILKHLDHGELSRAGAFHQVREWLQQEKVPAELLLEQVGCLLAIDDDQRYRLLAEPSLRERARLILSELATLDSTTRKAAARTQSATDRGIGLN